MNMHRNLEPDFHLLWPKQIPSVIRASQEKNEQSVVVPFKYKDEMPTLDELQAAVGGYIEIISLGGGYYMIINEEGKIKDLPANYIATTIARHHNAIFDKDYIAGNAIIIQEDLIE